jgi:hypothetical protein
MTTETGIRSQEPEFRSSGTWMPSKGGCGMSRREGATVAWHEVPSPEAEGALQLDISTTIYAARANQDGLLTEEGKAGRLTYGG